MRTETRYHCEICGRWFHEASGAMACEAKAIPTSPPIGLLDMGNDGDLYDRKYAFAIAGSAIDRHYVYANLWACRDSGAGDSLGDQVCGNQNDWGGVHEFDWTWLETPCMQRLVAWLRGQEIEPLVRVGDEYIRLNEALAR